MSRSFGVIMGFLLITSAQAASFDCPKAKSKIEKIICAVPKISNYDEELAKSYNVAINSLSPNGQVILKRGQVEWLRSVNFLCVQHNDPKQNIFNSSRCVEQKYKRRLDDMKSAAVRIGPYLFSRIDYYYPNKVDDKGRPYVGQTSYPRIDSPVTEMTKLWNALVAKTNKAEGDDYCDGVPADNDVNFQILSADKNIIYTLVSEDTFCHGTLHGWGGAHNFYYVLKPVPHLLIPRELFHDTSQTWESFLTDKCFVALQHKTNSADSNKSLVQKIATDPKSWTLKPEGLVITFNQGEVLAYGYGETQILIPWSELGQFILLPELIPK